MRRNWTLWSEVAGLGFGGSPWARSTIGAVLTVLFGIPQQMDTLRGYREEPRADIILNMLFLVSRRTAGDQCLADFRQLRLASVAEVEGLTSTPDRAWAWPKQTHWAGHILQFLYMSRRLRLLGNNPTSTKSGMSACVE
jgi:hypothetical protein